MLGEIFNGASDVEKIMALTKQIREIDSSIDTIRYNNELYGEIPDVVKKLANAKEAAIAELKTFA